MGSSTDWVEDHAQCAPNQVRVSGHEERGGLEVIAVEDEP